MPVTDNFVSKTALVDINDVTIDMNQPKEQRMSSYLEQIKNPYQFRCGDYTVKIRFSDTSATLQDKLVAYASSIT